LKNLEFKVKIVGVTNHCSTVIGTAKVNIRFPTMPESLQFNLYVIENFKYDLLLGTDFIKHFNADLQFSKNRLIIDEHFIPLEPFVFSHNLNPKDNSCNSILIKDDTISSDSDSNVINTLTNSDHKRKNSNLVNSKFMTEKSHQLICNATKINIEPQTVRRIPVKLNQELNDLNILEMTTELLLKGLYMPDLLLHKKYTENLYVPIINPSKNKIKIPNGFPIAEVIIFDQLPIEYTVLEENNSIQIGRSPSNLTNENSDHIENILSRVNKLATEEDKQIISELLTSYQDVFSFKGEIGTISCYKHRIKLLPGAKPVRRPPYRKPPHLENFEREKVEVL